MSRPRRAARFSLELLETRQVLSTTTTPLDGLALRALGSITPGLISRPATAPPIAHTPLVMDPSSGNPPLAPSSANPTVVADDVAVSGLDVSLTAFSNGALMDTFVGYQVNWGDGQVSSGGYTDAQATSYAADSDWRLSTLPHAYATAGSYLITVEVWGTANTNTITPAPGVNDSSMSGSVVGTVTVGPGINSDVTFGVASSDPPLTPVVPIPTNGSPVPTTSPVSPGQTPTVTTPIPTTPTAQVPVVPILTNGSPVPTTSPVSPGQTPAVTTPINGSPVPTTSPVSPGQTPAVTIPTNGSPVPTTSPVSPGQSNVGTN